MSPIVVNGLASNQVGDTGFWFLIRGQDEAFPYLALVDEQARVLLDRDERLQTSIDDVATASDLRELLARR